MRKLGIIGGAGPLASSLLYEEVIRECYRHGLGIPEIIILNYPFTRILSQQEEGSHRNQVVSELKHCISQLEDMGAEIAVLACNTMHLLLRTIHQGNLQFIGLPEAVLEEAKADRVRKLLFLGTENSCRSRLYDDPDIEMVFPKAREQKIIGEVIDRVLEGSISENDSREISRLIHQIASREPFDGVVLGCTDLPVLHHHFPIKCAFNLYDSIKIPSKKIRGSL